MRIKTGVLGCLAALLAVAAAPSAAAERPHVVLILVDDMGYGDPGCFNPESKIHTPHIDHVAAQGMRFIDAHAAGPLCHMSRYGLMTGRYPFRTDVSRWPTQPLIEQDQTTLASMLGKQGYDTAMVGKWHLGFKEQGYEQPLPGGPVDVGFDSFFGIRASTDIPPYFYIRDNRAVTPPTKLLAANQSDGWSPIQGAFWRQGLIAADMDLADVLPRFTDEAVGVIREHAARPAKPAAPLFLYVAFPAPHTPWLPSPEFSGASQAGLYGDFTQMVDAMIGRILAALEQAGYSDDTLLLITSDNGPVWYAEDVRRFDHDSAGRLRGMKADAWEAGHRMPFIVRWPGVVQPRTTSEQLVSFTDLLATLAAITGYELAVDEGPDSFDFSPALRGQAQPQATGRGGLALQSGGGLMTYREGKWKLIDGLGSGGFSSPRKVKPEAGEPAFQLYDLEKDPGETTNLASQQPQVVARLRGELQRVVHSEGHRRPSP